MRIGILALQGGFQAHADCLARHGVASFYVRTPESLAKSDALIIPGGESVVFIRLLHESGLWPALCSYSKPIFGTCAGAILLSKQILSHAQESLNRIAINITRNAYGRQTASELKTGSCLITQQEIEMLFIRAPKIEAVGSSQVKILAKVDQQIVAVQEGHCIAATFHPELNEYSTLHAYFIQEMIKKQF
jgi:pyridoxal 5'-phosphate synthase pdxT subunit